MKYGYICILLFGAIACSSTRALAQSQQGNVSTGTNKIQSDFMPESVLKLDDSIDAAKGKVKLKSIEFGELVERLQHRSRLLPQLKPDDRTLVWQSDDGGTFYYLAVFEGQEKGRLVDVIIISFDSGRIVPAIDGRYQKQISNLKKGTSFEDMVASIGWKYPAEYIKDDAGVYQVVFHVPGFKMNFRIYVDAGTGKISDVAEFGKL